MIERFLLGDATATLADNDHQLGLIVEAFGLRGPQDGLTCRDQAFACAQEQRGIGRHLVAALFRVLGIIESEAVDVAGARQREARRQRVNCVALALVRLQLRGDLGEQFGPAGDHIIQLAREFRIEFGEVDGVAVFFNGQRWLARARFTVR